MNRFSNRRGFALPAALLVVVLLTLLIAGTFTRARGELRAGADQSAQTKAYVVAQMGLEQFMLAHKSAGEVADTTISAPGMNGEAHVSMTLVRAGDPVTNRAPIYVVRSRGVSFDPAFPGTPQAEHTVTQYAPWVSADIDVPGAIIDLAGVWKSGTSGTISGVDECGNKAPIAAVSVPNNWAALSGSFKTTTNPDGTTTIGPFTGDPVAASLGSVEDAANSVKVDWAGILNGTAVVPDVEIPGDPWPSAAEWADPNFWPVIKVNGDYDLQPGQDGRGTLIVTGNLTVKGSNVWDGIMLLGGTMIGNGSNTVSGGIISGLNQKIAPGSVPPADFLNGKKTIKFNSCYIESAKKGMQGLVDMPNTWADNWATY
jgi:type II secretory pathway pseudopilin PulG